MNKYELAVVLSAKLEDDERTAALEKVKGYITRFGGTITDVDEWGKKRLAYEIQKMKEGFYYFIQFESDSILPQRSGSSCSHYGAGNSDTLCVRSIRTRKIKKDVIDMNKVILNGQIDKRSGSPLFPGRAFHGNCKIHACS